VVLAIIQFFISKYYFLHCIKKIYVNISTKKVYVKVDGKLRSVLSQKGLSLFPDEYKIGNEAFNEINKIINDKNRKIFENLKEKINAEAQH
jgi:hypothetical protein